jgi:membrane protein implicated in regulation of membrane protease activity
MVLLYVYIAALVLGGVLLGASLLLGHDGDADVDVDVDADVDLDSPDADVDLHADVEGHDAGGFGDIWLPFASLRFWVFFLTFFGLTGTVLAFFALAGRWPTLVAALGMGAGVGLAAAYAVRKLKQQVVGEIAGVEDYKGLEATVLLPIAADGRGKVRLTVRDQTVDLMARGEQGQAYAVGERVLVIDVAEGELRVVRVGELQSET